jgi:hypothetical protein
MAQEGKYRGCPEHCKVSNVLEYAVSMIIQALPPF